jgi:hypothetical protein
MSSTMTSVMHMPSNSPSVSMASTHHPLAAVQMLELRGAEPASDLQRDQYDEATRAALSENANPSGPTHVTLLKSAALSARSATSFTMTRQPLPLAPSPSTG